MAQAETVASNEDQSFTFVKGDFKDLPALVTKLQDARDPLSQHILDSFGTVTKRLLEGYDPSRPDDQDLREALTSELNSFTHAGPLYDEERFADVGVTAEARRLIQQRPEGAELVRLNTILLEIAYPDELSWNIASEPEQPIDRVQTGMRVEKRMLKVLKALAELHEMSLGELVEDIVLHAFAGVSTYDHPRWLERIEALKGVYGMDYSAHDSRRFAEPENPP